MEREWPSVPLGEVCDLFDGPHQTAPLTPDGPVVYLNVGDIRGGRIELRLSGRVSEDTARSWSNRVIPEAGDVVFGYEATLGDAAVLPDSHRWCLGRRVGLLRPRRHRVDPRFLAYSWYSPQFQETLRANRVGGSTIESIRLTDLPSWTITLPQISEQRAIAHILGTLDDKVELNRRMSETLEAIARVLFKSWFVAFDPVRAKSEGRDPGLPPHLADLLPDSFEDSELGEIPTGWRVGPFGDVVEQLRDQENPLSSPDSLFHHFSIPAFDEGQNPRLEYGANIRSLKLRVPSGVILLSKLNPEIERVWMVDVGPGERAVCSTEFLVLRALSPFTRTYAYCLARSPLFRRQIEGLVTGTSKSHQRAHAESILKLAVVVPPSPLVKAFDGFADCLLTRTLDCRQESHTLAGLRDALLPKLVSGELRLQDADRLIETARA